MVTEDDLKDDEEFGEVVTDVREECGKLFPTALLMSGSSAARCARGALGVGCCR
jgi:hypothetical protein